MKIYYGLVVATVMLLGGLGDCRAQFYTGWLPSVTDTGKQIDSLKAAFRSEPQPKTTQLSPNSPYYDVDVENICFGDVRNLTRAWVQQQYLGVSSFDRVAQINAFVEFRPTGGPPILRSSIPILLEGSPSYAASHCQDLSIRGIPRNKITYVTLKLILAERLSPGTKTALRNVANAIANLSPQGRLARIAVTTVGFTAKAVFPKDERLTQETFAQGTRPFSWTGAIGQDAAEAHLQDKDKDWARLVRYPRPNLLNYGPDADYHRGPGTDPWKIPDEINSLFAYSPKTDSDDVWRLMQHNAGIEELDWSRPADVKKFCNTFRGELESWLHVTDHGLSVRLALYAHFMQNMAYYQQSGSDQAKTGCLTAGQWEDLKDHGYITNFGS